MDNKQRSYSFSLYSSFSSNSSISKKSSFSSNSFTDDIFQAIKNNNIFSLNSLFIRSDNNVKLFNKTTDFYITPLIYAITLNHIDCVRTLIDIGVDINKPDELKNTPLHIACLDGNYEIIELLLQNNADINK